MGGWDVERLTIELLVGRVAAATARALRSAAGLRLYSNPPGLPPSGLGCYY